MEDLVVSDKLLPFLNLECNLQLVVTIFPFNMNEETISLHNLTSVFPLIHKVCEDRTWWCCNKALQRIGFLTGAEKIGLLTEALEGTIEQNDVVVQPR